MVGAASEETIGVFIDRRNTLHRLLLNWLTGSRHIKLGILLQPQCAAATTSSVPVPPAAISSSAPLDHFNPSKIRSISLKHRSLVVSLSSANCYKIHLQTAGFILTEPESIMLVADHAASRKKEIMRTTSDLKGDHLFFPLASKCHMFYLEIDIS
ncbi:adenosine kinase [Salvia divinorum]|uniref:Adenosine kinase n=1 Tax=Salvia divinorum TaxID=28513 RepID=A0ABD1G8I2_SALDI